MWFFRRRLALAESHTDATGLEALIRTADIARDEGKAEAAAADYAAAIALAPERNDIKVQLGNMLKDTGRLREADQIYEAAQAADPEDADICVQRGHVRKLLGDRVGALAQYRKAAVLDPESFGATEELADVGGSWQQQKRFEVHFRAGGSEALMQMSHQIAAMRHALEELAAQLPDPLGQTAFPLDTYGLFRELHTVPPPPAGARAPVTVLLCLDREPVSTLAAQLAALTAQSLPHWTLIAIGAEPERQAMLARAAASDPRIRPAAPLAGEEPAVAEWRLARAVTQGVLVLLAQGALLHGEALAWAAALPGLVPADAVVCDEDEARPARGGFEHAAPVLRPVVDYDTLLEANVFGETIVVGAAAYAAACPAAPEGPLGRARSRLLLELARTGRVAHLPHVLVSRLDGVRLSLPEHRLAVEAHAAAHGFGDRIAVARGETGPTHWRARTADAALTVVIPTRDAVHDLQLFVRSLRERASVPDALRFVLVESGPGGPEGRAGLEALGAKRYVTLLSDPEPFSWPRAVNRGARAAETPLLVFAHDDMLMLTEAWDERLRGLLERDEVGAVGARLLYGDDTLQHGGVLFGWKGQTIYDGLYAAGDDAGPARRFAVTRATSAVTGAFLAMRRDRFADCGGFDEAGLPFAYAAADLCLRLRQRGLRILWTPAVTLRHDEAKMRGVDHLMPERAPRHAAALALMHARWGRGFAAEPALNPVFVPATAPFRLLAAPSAARVLDHLRLSARPNPWAVEPPMADDAGAGPTG